MQIVERLNKLLRLVSLWFFVEFVFVFEVKEFGLPTTQDLRCLVLFNLLLLNNIVEVGSSQGCMLGRGVELGSVYGVLLAYPSASIALIELTPHV